MREGGWENVGPSSGTNAPLLKYGFAQTTLASAAPCPAAAASTIRAWNEKFSPLTVHTSGRPICPTQSRHVIALSSCSSGQPAIVEAAADNDPILLTKLGAATGMR